MRNQHRRPSPQRQRIARRRFLAGAAVTGVAAAAMSMAGCDDEPRPTTGSTPTGPQPGGILKSLIDEEPATLDPITPSGGVGNQLAAFVYSRLLRFKPAKGAFADGTFEPDILSEWEQPDETTLVMRLRDGVRFDPRPPTHGRALAAEDVVLSWERFAAQGTYRADMANAVNKEAPVISVAAKDAQTIEMKLAFPDAQLLPTLASRFGLWVLPKEAFSDGFEPKTDMRGSGPWLLERFQPSVGLKFKKNPNYYGAPWQPLLDGVDLPVIADTAQAEAQFKARNIHGGPALGGGAVAVTDILSFHRDLKETRIDLAPPPLIGPTISFGWREGSPFKDRRVRQAVSMLIDRDTFIEVFNDLSAFQAAGVAMQAYWNTPLSAGWDSYWLDPKSSRFGPAAKYFRHDVAEAKKLLAAAGYPDGFETPFTFLAGPNWGRDWGQRAETLMAMLAKGGIRSNANAVDYNSVFIPQYLRRQGDFEGMAMQRTGSRGDPGQFWQVFFSSTGASNQVGRNFPDLDALILKQRRELDPGRRIEAMHEIQRYFAEHIPAVPQGGHTEEPALTWQGLHGPDEHFIWGGGDLGSDAFPYYWIDHTLRG